MHFLLLFALCLSSAFAADDKLYLFKDMPKERKLKIIKEYFYEHVETDHYLNMKSFEKLYKKCNPTWRITYSGEINYCLDKSYFAIWAGSGSYSFKNEDGAGHFQTLAASSLFLGGQMMFSTSLQSLIVVEGKYFYLPTFKEDDIQVENLNSASYSTLDVLYQRRFTASSFSYRVGGFTGRVPVLENTTGSEILSEVVLANKPVIYFGPLIGIKFAPGRDKSGVFSFYADFIPVVLQDGEGAGFGEFYNVRTGLQWFLHRYWAITADLEVFKISNKSDDEVTGRSLSLGVKFYAF